MSQKFWLSAVALGGCLALGAVGLLGSTHYQQACKIPSEERSSEASNTPNKTSSESDVFERIARSLEVISAAADTPEKAEREIADLIAQQDMACWAYWMVLISSAQAVVGIFGLAALIVTVRQGQRALRIGRDSIKAARQSTDATISKDRAFVFVDNIEVHQITDEHRTKVLSYYAVVRWKNAGTTPTKAFRNCVNIRLWPDPLPEDALKFECYAKEFTRAVIGPGATINSGGLPIEFSTAMAAYQDQERMKWHLLVWGWCEYNDVFIGTPRHRTEFCRKILVNVHPEKLEGNLGIKHFPFTKYNNTDDECVHPLATNPPNDGS